MDKTFEEGILAGLADAVAYAKGDKSRASVSKFKFPIIDVKKIRKKWGLSQKAFSEVCGINTRTLQEWEHGRRVPSGPSRILLAIINTSPQVIPRAMRSLGRAPLLVKKKKAARNIDGKTQKSRIKKMV